MDGVRVTFAFMGIMFHMAVWYVLHPQALTLVKAVDYSRTFFWVIEIIRLFRMDTFFLIAGFFAAMGMVKYDLTAFLKLRITKLHVLNVVPIVFLLTTIICYLLQLSLGDVGPLSTQYWKSLVFEHHLWFLKVLFIYYIFYWILVKKTNLINVLQNKTQPFHLILLAFTYLMWAVLAKIFPILWTNNFLVETVFRVFIYLPYFILGTTMYFNKQLADNFMRLSLVRILVCCTLILAYLYFVNQQYGMINGHVQPAFFALKLLTYLLKGAANLCAVYLIFLVSSNIFKSDGRLLKYLGDRSYTVYLLHFPLCLIFGYLFTKVHLDVRFEYMVSVFSIYAITLLMHDVLVKPITLKAAELKSSTA